MKFVNPEIEIILFGVADLIATSGDPIPGGNGNGNTTPGGDLILPGDWD